MTDQYGNIVTPVPGGNQYSAPGTDVSATSTPAAADTFKTPSGVTVDSKTGQPVVDPLAAPSSADVKTGFDTMLSNLSTDYAASNLPEARAQAIQDAEQKRADVAKSLINSGYDSEKQRLLDTEIMTEGGIAARGGQGGGTGSGLGMSTIQAATIAIAKKESEKTIADLGKRRDEALAKEDMDSWTRYKADIKDEEQKLKDIRDTEWQHRMDIINTTMKVRSDSFNQQLALEKYGLDVKQFNVGQDRFERTQGLAVSKYNYDISQDDMKTMNTNLANMAKGQIPLDQISEEERTAFEMAAKMIPGSFDAVYSRLLDDAKQGNAKDALGIQKLQADLANIYNEIKNRNSDNARQNTQTQADSVLNKLLLHAGPDGYVDPVAYAYERSLSSLKPGEFDLRFGHVLNPRDRDSVNIYTNVERDAGGASNSSLAQ